MSKPIKVKFILFLVGAVALVASWIFLRSPETPPTQASVAPQPGQEIVAEKLLGRWQRPDGGYVLEFRNAKADGRLDAGYFNPRPINVARAEWLFAEGRLQVFVELRDINYPGSTYTLNYFPEQDLLAGIYFQAVQQQNFDVEFVRLQ
jgi:hypothetical protein